MGLDKKCLRILLIEDNEADAFLTREVLSESTSNDYGITTARDGVEALTLLRKGKRREASHLFDLILLDLSLPKMSSGEFLKELTRDSALELTPVVVLTASSEPGCNDKVKDLGASNFLSKPLDLQMFEATLMTLGLLS